MDGITVYAFDLVNVCIRSVVKTAFVDHTSRVERVAFKIGHSFAVRFSFVANDGNSDLAVVLEPVALVSVPPGLSPFRGIVRSYCPQNAVL